MNRFLTVPAVVLVGLASILFLVQPAAAAAKPKPKPIPPRTAVIVLENHGYSQIVGNPEMPYFNSLIPQGTLATNYNGITHPSLPNYLALIGGSTYGINTDCTDCAASGSNLAVQLAEAHLSWRAYMEDMPEPCYGGATYGNYAKKHNPFAYFESVVINPSLCQNVVPSSQLEVDLHSKKGLPTFTWITPNLCNDGHDCILPTVDGWLAAVVPQIVGKLGPEGVLVITFDEGSGTELHIPALFVGPGARKGIQLTGSFNHYSLLATIESRYHLPRLNEAALATPMKGAILPPKKKKHHKKKHHKNKHHRHAPRKHRSARR